MAGTTSKGSDEFPKDRLDVNTNILRKSTPLGSAMEFSDDSNWPYLSAIKGDRSFSDQSFTSPEMTRYVDGNEIEDIIEAERRIHEEAEASLLRQNKIANSSEYQNQIQSFMNYEEFCACPDAEIPTELLPSSFATPENARAANSFVMSHGSINSTGSEVPPCEIERLIIDARK